MIILKKRLLLGLGNFLRKCKLDKDRFYVTIYEGSKADKVGRDNEAFNIWSKLIHKNI